MSEIPVPGVYGRKALIQKNCRGNKMHYHNLRYLFEQHSGPGGSDALLNGPDEVLNFRDMLFLDAQFRFMPRAITYFHSGLNSKPLCVCVILKPS